MEKTQRPFMSKLSDLRLRMRSLKDIEGILNAMKNLSLVEMTKISRFYVTQQELLHSVEETLADFQQFYGEPTETGGTDNTPLYVLIGSERGFCGGFNETIQKALDAHLIADASVRLILVGRKLALKFLQDKRVVASLDGPSAAEEIPLVISQLANTLTRMSSTGWKILHNSYTTAGTGVETISPFEFPRIKTAGEFQFPPFLYLTPPDLRPQIFEQYLFALFYGIFYQSFMAENHERLRHMDGALNKLKEDEERLRRQSNSLWQENITEELEIIMLSVESEITRPSD
jgi:F-type H+-transporting ATPase subunit gamma